MKLNERLGVPEGINKQATDLYKKLFISLDKLLLNDKISIPKLSDENPNFTIVIARYNLKINNLELKRIPFLLRLHNENVDVPRLFSAGYSNKNKRYISNNNDIIQDQDIEDSILSLNVAINSSSTKEQIINEIKNELTPDTIAHELMHLYEASKRRHTSIISSAEYHSYSQKGFPDIISDFLFLLYFTTSVENIVRPTQLYHQLLDNNITKNQFKDFLKKSDIIKNLEDAQNFSLKEFKDKLNNNDEVEKIIQRVVSEGYVRIGDNSEDILNILMNTIISSTVKEIESMLKSYVDNSVSIIDIITSRITGTPTASIVKSQEEANHKFKELISKYKKYENNPNKYFEYLKKRLNFVGDKMKRKLYKLYDMVEDDKKQSTILNWNLHTKINSRNNESIVLNFDTFKNLFKKVR
jgi:hypothetical protein